MNLMPWAFYQQTRERVCAARGADIQPAVLLGFAFKEEMPWLAEYRITVQKVQRRF